MASSITLAEAKTHLRITNSDSDTYISTLLDTVEVWAEVYTNRVFLTTTKHEYYSQFPVEMVLRYGLVQSVTSITYLDSDGASQTLASTVYQLDTSRPLGRITEAYGQTWATARDVPNSIDVEYVAGYGAASAVPDDIKHALKMMVMELYDRRASSSEVKTHIAPMHALYLLDRVKVGRII